MKLDLAVRRARIVSGCVLVAYLLCHLTSHAAGLFKFEAMTATSAILLAPWQTLPTQVLLYGSFLLHLSLAFVALFRRRTLRMPAGEALQMLLGFSVPLLLLGHLVGVRLGYALNDWNPSYARLLGLYWVTAPAAGAQQAIVLVVAWSHAMFGLHAFLRFRPWFKRAQPWLLLAAVLVPSLSLAGFAAAGFDVAQRAAQDPGFVAQAAAADGIADPAGGARLAAIAEAARSCYLALLVLVLSAWTVRRLLALRRTIRIAYPGGRQAAAPRGVSVLEASRLNGIPHTSACGGRGRCSTCRIRVIDGGAALPPPLPLEAATLARIGGCGDVRLACQLRPTGDLAVVPLVEVAAAPDGTRMPAHLLAGHETRIAAMFVDMRGSTTLAESMLPFDVVFVVDRYVRTVTRAVEGAGGIVTSVAGDGVMAMFGHHGDGARGCREALAAAVAVHLAIDGLNGELARSLGWTIRIGMGLAHGSSVVGAFGEVGGHRLQFLGDTGNTAARLEQLTKERAVPLIAAASILDAAGIHLPDAARASVPLRGRAEPLEIVAIADLAALGRAAPGGASAAT
ncbi:MAG: adenylate/guanylate cyclase domain-containing protein [Alphaproteobacteria bacterium]|nr:adenylate/guanylate cyclase domain-containing protein [Alphaproteobacteria bacterium]